MPKVYGTKTRNCVTSGMLLCQLEVCCLTKFGVAQDAARYLVQRPELQILVSKTGLQTGVCTSSKSAEETQQNRFHAVVVGIQTQRSYLRASCHWVHVIQGQRSYRCICCNWVHMSHLRQIIRGMHG